MKVLLKKIQKKKNEMGEPGDQEPYIVCDNRLNECVDRVLELKGKEGLFHFTIVKHFLLHHNFETS